MAEKTLGEIGFLKMWKNDNPQYKFSDCGYEKDWEAAAEAIVAAHEARRWRAIESAPKDHYIMAWSPERDMSFQVIWNGGYFDWEIIGSSDAATMKFTKWAPIPAPPKEAE